MKCDICKRPAIARLVTRVEALDLTNWPPEFLGAANSANTSHLCPVCLKTFMQQGAEVMESLDPTGKLIHPEPLTEFRPPDPTALKIAALNVVDPEPGEDYFEDFTDEHGNTYTRTDRGWVLSESGPDGPAIGVLGPGRRRPKPLN